MHHPYTPLTTNIMKAITFPLFATVRYYFANGLEEEASTFLRGGGSGVNNVKRLAREEEGVEMTNVVTTIDGDGDDGDMNLHERQLQFLLWDCELCSINSQCISGCCSGTYSGGVFQCSPSYGAICSAGGSDGGGGVSLGDWEFCTTSVIVMERMYGVPISQIQRLREAGVDRSFVERSYFAHDGAGWRYLAGDLLPAAVLKGRIEGLTLDAFTRALEAAR